jgi:two-component system, OmpR family, sensor kinase
MAGLHLSLRTRLTVLTAVGAAIVITAGSLLLYSGLSSTLDDAVTAELRVRADDAAAELRAGAPPVVGGGLVTQVLTRSGRLIAPLGDDPLLSPAEARRVGREEIIDRPVPAIGDAARIVARPAGPGAPDQIVAVAGSTAPIQRAQDRLEVVVGVAGPIMAVVLAALAWVLTGAALRPVRRMSRRAATISLREPDARLPQPPGRDEIADLGRTLNQMLDRIEETIAHERAFVDDASHELRTPLAVLRGELELARLELDDHNDPARTADALESGMEETDRLARLTEHLLALARADAGHLVARVEPIPLQKFAVEAAQVIDRDRLSLDVEGEEVIAAADPLSLGQLVLNLLVNANGFARHRIRIDTSRNGDKAVLRVSDDGPGFDAALLGREFDRFSRGDSARGRGGAGLGLSIVAAVTQALEGQVDAGNGPPLGGAWVEVRLPTPRWSTPSS